MNALSTYTEVSHRSASPEQLVILLYERAIKGQILAIDALEEGDGELAGAELRRCREIFVELASALDHEAAPQLAGNLHRLYLWAVRELLRASRDADPAPLEGTLEMTETLYGAMKDALS